MDNSELRALFERLRSGDEEAFRKIYGEMKTPVFTVIMRTLQQWETAEDVFQDLFVKLYVSPPEPHVSDVCAYIFRMARNMSVDVLRRERRFQSIEESDEYTYDDGSDPLLRLDIEAAMRTLPLVESQIVTLHLTGGLKFREVADIVSMPLGTVLGRYRKAIKKLRTLLMGGTL